MLKVRYIAASRAVCCLWNGDQCRRHQLQIIRSTITDITPLKQISNNCHYNTQLYNLYFQVSYCVANIIIYVPYNICENYCTEMQLYCRLYFYAFRNINLSSLPANRGTLFFSCIILSNKEYIIIILVTGVGFNMCCLDFIFLYVIFNSCYVC